MAVIKAFVKNYGYGSYIGVLSCTDDSEWKKAALQYYQVLANGSLKPEIVSGKETKDLEKMARTFINSQKDYVLWNY